MEISTWRVISALAVGLRTFLKTGKSAKNPFKRLKMNSCVQRGEKNELLKLDVVDFRASEALCACEVDLVVTVSCVSNECIVIQLLLVVQSDDVEVK